MQTLQEVNASQPAAGTGPTSWDWDLIQRYDKAGPRYTSYPTAVQFHDGVQGDQVLEHLGQRCDTEKGLSLYVHVPFCHQLCWYCGCNMRVSRKPDQIADHIAVIQREIDLTSEWLRGDRRVFQLHFGGGTPNYAGPQQLQALMTTLRRRFVIQPEAEISIEVDPRLLDEARLEHCHDLGFNRISMGIQDFDPKVQKAINRRLSLEKVTSLLQSWRTLSQAGVNMDLIYGLPLQTPGSFKHTLDAVIDLAPERIALFNFAYMPWLKPHQKLIRESDLPRPEQKFEILQQTVESLAAAGYVAIGMDHFAKPSDPLAQALSRDRLHRNFQGYTTMPDLEMLGFGMSAISMFDGLYVQNHNDLRTYERSIEESRPATWRGVVLTEDDRLRRGIINHLMCRSQVDLDMIEAMVGIPFDQYFPGARERLDEMTRDGLLIRDDQRYRTTETGRLLLRNVAMVFDAYLPKLNGDRRFSRTV
ncbi:oxygen-independent coproporphyrinogen III oxidase [Sulfidibacter corallicola]|uniref:Coproporphyrinogen-III oxidase n=1 Tax=Sulfidibacter corallicola TaxID=2818388 RepID=A0A8A4TKS7_SULCO|nr:oxygen-independent coproporphyrinogen III oxidase [Sulfidibacter corallicola]QTD49732.1 oxygen-independent coproporphyrinogen III oxidase [Sulfidibacter corallicola]